MANNRIKGITIELGADTTGLTAALKDVNKESSKVQSELKEVERALKLDPSNTELVAQQQQLLAEQIQNTSNKLDVLKTAQSQVEAQFRSGEIGAEQYRAFQRELATTEASLQRYQNQMTSTVADQERLGRVTNELQTFFQATGTEVNQFADVLGTRLTNAIRDGSATSDQMNRALRLMGQHALGAGADIDQMREALRRAAQGADLNEVRQDLARITQEANQAEEAVNGFGQELSGVVAGLAAGGGIAATIQQALEVSSLNTKIDISFNVPEESKASIREAVKSIEAYGVDGEEALEGIRRQWALNKDASDEVNSSIVQGAGVVAKAYAGIDFIELIQEVNEIGAALEISNEDALALTNSLLKAGFPPEQLDIIAEYGLQMKQIGFSTAEIQAIFQKGVDLKSWNIDNLNDGVKEANLQMRSFGQEVPKALADLLKGTDVSTKQMQEWGKAVAAGGEGGAKAMSEVAEWLSTIEDDSLKNALAIAVFGTKAEDQADNMIAVFQGLADAQDKTKQNQDDLNATIERMNQDPTVTMKQALADLQTALAPVLAEIAKVIAKIAEWVSENPNLAATITAIVTTVGILTGAFATLMPAIGSFVGMLGGGTAAVGALGTAISVLTGPIGLTVAAVAGLGIGVYAVSQEFSKSSIEVESWSNKVSEGTAQAVGSYLDLEQQATNAFHQIAWSGETVTQEMATKMVGMYDQMGQQVLTEMQTDHAAQLEEMTNFYANSNALTDEREAEILAKMKEKQVEQQTVIQEGNARIKEIWETASAEKRGITEAEEKEIDAINLRMKENAIKHLSESERDQKLILENLKTESTEITATQAAEVVKNSNKQKEETIKNAEDTYNETKKNAQMQRDELGIISEEEYQKIVGEAKKTRDDTIKNAEEMHEKVVGEAKTQATEHVEQVNWETGEVLSKWEVFKNNASKKWDEIKNNASKKWEEMKSTIEKKMTEVKKKIETKWNEAETFLEKINLLQIGKDIVNGLIKGIGDMFGDVRKKVESLAGLIPDWAKEKLGIKSPSRVFAQIGQWISEGWAIGIEEKGNMVKNAVSDIALTAQDIAEYYVSEEKKLRSKANEDIKKIETDKVSEIAKIEKRMHEDVAKAQRAASSKKKKTTQDDALKIQRIREDAAAKILKLETTSDEKIKSLKSKSTKEIIDLESKMNKDLLEETKRYIDDKKSLDQLSLIEEAQIWEQSMKLFAEGTQERIKAQQEYKKATEAVSKEITAINTDFSNQIQKINDDLIKQEETLTKAYSDAVDKRAQSLVSFKGLFDEFKVEMDVTGEQLLANLFSQVDGFKLWQKEIEKISGRAIDKGLLEELRQMGPNALPELVALNQLTDSQLQQYSNLYKEKSKLARTQAEAELKGMKDDTDKQIKALRDVANKQLTTLESEWNAKIKSLTNATSTELSSLEQIGKDAGNGLLIGLSSTSESIRKKALEIAESVSKTISGALKIKSPSRVTMGFGVNINEGLIKGIEQSQSKLQGAMNSVYGSLASSANKSQANQIAQQQQVINQSSNIDLSTLVAAITQLASRPVETIITMEGQQVARAVTPFVTNIMGNNYNSELRRSGVK